MKLKNGGMLLLTAFIWGTAFVAQSVGMDHLGPFLLMDPQSDRSGGTFTVYMVFEQNE